MVSLDPNKYLSFLSASLPDSASCCSKEGFSSAKLVAVVAWWSKDISSCCWATSVIKQIKRPIFKDPWKAVPPARLFATGL